MSDAISYEELLEQPDVKAEMALHSAECAVGHLREVMVNYPTVAAHYKNELGELANEFFALANRTGEIN